MNPKQFFKRNYWLKWGIAFALATLFYAAVIYILISRGVSPEFYGSPWMFFLVGEYFPSSLPVCLAIYFALGSIVGMVIERIKENKKP